MRPASYHHSTIISIIIIIANNLIQYRCSTSVIHHYHLSYRETVLRQKFVRPGIIYEPNLSTQHYRASSLVLIQSLFLVSLVCPEKASTPAKPASRVSPLAAIEEKHPLSLVDFFSCIFLSLPLSVPLSCLGCCADCCHRLRKVPP